jgi:ubiquilin
MQAALSSPLMDSMMQNPELLASLISSNPAMREMMERSPELAHALRDPSVLRQALEAARNPALLREHMRTNDRAFANLDISAEGYNALRRLHSETSPLHDMAAAAAAAAPAANPFASLFAPAPQLSGGLNATPLPNPWAPAAAPPPSAVPQFGMGGMGGFPGGLGFGGGGGTPGLDGMEDMMASPLFGSMMEQMAANPQLFDAMAASDPRIQQQLNANPGLRSMMTPENLRAMADPANLRAMAQMQAAMSQLQGSGLSGLGGLGALGGMGGMGGLGAGLAGLGVPPPGSTPPEELYAAQLRQMAEMGFVDVTANVTALRATGGNVHAAVERLLGSS